MAKSTNPRITFETNTLASAVSKAARVAPTKGAAFDKAAGLLIEVDPAAQHEVTIKSTDLEVTYMEWINALTIEADKMTFRVPSALFTGILSGLPIGSEVTLEITDTHILILCGKKRAKVLRIDPRLSFLKWEPFDPDGLTTVDNFSALVAQVSWACATDSIPYTGVHMDGTYLWATDKYKLTRVPCAMEVDEPITAPLGILRPIFKNLSDARLAATSSKLLLMPDEFTQVTSVIFHEPYPDIAANLLKKLTHNASFTIDRERFRDAVNSMMVLCRADRYPRTVLTIGGSRVHVYMDVPDVGEMEDEIEVDGAEHDDHVVHFTPTYITTALDASSTPEVTFAYDTKNSLSLGHISDGSDYNAWFTARRETDN